MSHDILLYPTSTTQYHNETMMPGVVTLLCQMGLVTIEECHVPCTGDARDNYAEAVTLYFLSLLPAEALI